VNVKLLLDENLSPVVAERLRSDDSVDAIHLRDRDLLEATDDVVLERAYADDRILVTCNVADFLRLARAREIHPGIVLVEEGDLLRDEQLQVVRAAISVLRGQRDLINRVLRIWLDGKAVMEDPPP
jgi:predicted nuclease of predicted toxin-antitoxin system